MSFTSVVARGGKVRKGSICRLPSDVMLAAHHHLRAGDALDQDAVLVELELARARVAALAVRVEHEEAVAVDGGIERLPVSRRSPWRKIMLVGVRPATPAPLIAVPPLPAVAPLAAAVHDRREKRVGPP